jgi:hypothetical protein
MAEGQDDATPAETNDQLVLVSGASSTGKSASLMNIRNQPNWLYLNTEAGKRLPFKNQFMNGGFRIEDPYQVWEAFDHATNNLGPVCKGAIVDSMTFLMDMFESQYIIGAADTMKGWSSYQQFFKTLMQQKIVAFGKPVIITAHVKEIYDEKTLSMKSFVPIKGALANNGVEAYFSTVVSSKKMEIRNLEPYKSDLLNITDEDKELGYKHVFQTRPTKDTVGERIRSPMGMFTREQTFMDNDCQVLLDHLDRFYKA